MATGVVSHHMMRSHCQKTASQSRAPSQQKSTRGLKGRDVTVEPSSSAKMSLGGLVQKVSHFFGDIKDRLDLACLESYKEKLINSDQAPLSSSDQAPLSSFDDSSRNIYMFSSEGGQPVYSSNLKIHEIHTRQGNIQAKRFSRQKTRMSPTTQRVQAATWPSIHAIPRFSS